MKIIQTGRIDENSSVSAHHLERPLSFNFSAAYREKK